MSYLLWFLVLVWLVSILFTIYGVASQKPILPTADVLHNTPLVSIIVAARNEEHRVLKESLRSMLAQSYERFEIIAVDDRSTDSTRRILKSLAIRDGRLHVIKGEELPVGWLGKTYALHQALRHARGEWILATDADMLFEKDALRTAIATAVKKDADAITLIPHFEAKSFWERVIIPSWSWVMLMFTVSHRIHDPKTKGALGLGGFFLMRRTILDRIGSYEALKNEVLEDVRLAERIKAAGGRMIVEWAPALVRTRMYRNLAEIWESCTKSWFAGMKFSLSFSVLCVVWMWMLSVLPPAIAVISFVRLLSGAHVAELLVPAMMAWLGQMIVLVLSCWRFRVPSLYALTAPLGLAMLYAMLLDSSLRIATGRGVKWRGRLIYDRSGVRPPQVVR